MRKISILAFWFITIVLTASPSLVPLADGDNYARLSDNNEELLVGDYKTGKESSVVVFKDMRSQPLQRVDCFYFSPDGSRILLQLQEGAYYVYNVNSKRCDRLSKHDPQEAPLFSPDGKLIAFVHHNNIYVKRLEYDTEVQLTEDTSDSIFNGLRSKSFTHAFGICASMAWSKDSKQLVYTKNQGVYIYNMHFKWTKELSLPGEGGKIITKLAWTNNATNFTVIYLDDTQSVLRVAMVDANTLIAKKVYEERADSYISPENAQSILFFPENDNFALLSDADGNNHLYLYSKVGTFIQQVTKGDFDITKLYAYDAKSKQIFYQSNAFAKDGRGVYAVSLKNAKIKPIAVENGTNDARFSTNYKYFELQFSSLTQAYRYSVHTIKGKEIRLLKEDETPTSLQKEIFQFGHQKGWLLRKDDSPRPLLMYVTDARNVWQMDIAYKLAEKGYVVAAVNVSGSKGGGIKQEKEAYEQIFVRPAEDYISAANFLISKNLVDENNLFIMGKHLDGGVVLSALVAENTPYKGGVAVAPVTDLLNYNPLVMLRLMHHEGVTGAYKTNGAVYNAEKLQGKHLLLIHALEDQISDLDNTYRLVEELVEENIQFNMHLYPKKNENYINTLDEPHLSSKIINFLRANNTNHSY